MLLKNQKGIGLVETVVALGVTVVVLTALVSLAVSTLRTSNLSKLKLRSSKFANSELELVRACRDAHQSWNAFLSTLSDNNCDSQGCYISVVGDGQLCATGSDLGVVADADGKVYDQGGPLELWVGFTVADSSDGSIDLNDEIVRVTVWTRSDTGGVVSENFIYSDLTDWRGN